MLDNPSFTAAAQSNAPSEGTETVQQGQQGQSGEPWFLAYTKPRAEHQALFNLQQQDFEVYLPLYKKFRKTENGPVSVFEAMFPRYIFFRPSRPGQSIATVRSTKGVNNLVRFGFEPALVTNTTLDLIREVERARREITLQEASPFKSGQTVRLKHTALENIQGLVHSVGSQRIAVLLEIMGRATLVQVEHHQLEVE